jgi:Xaa-Pro aminopeptidase
MLGLIEHVSGGGLPAGQPAYPDFEAAEFATRYARLTTLMTDADIDAVVVAQPANIRYFTGLRTWLWALPPVIPIIAVLPRDPAQATILDTATELGGILETTWITDPVTYAAGDDPLDLLRLLLERRGLAAATLGLELSGHPHLSPKLFDRLRRLLPEATVTDATSIIGSVRMLKSEAEVARLRAAASVAQTGFRAAYQALAVGTSEIELTNVAAQAMLAAGASVATDPMILIFMSGPERYRQPLQPATRRALKAGELIALDGGCVVDGYHADFARCAAIGSLSAQASELVEVTQAALDAAVCAIAPGAAIGDAWVAADAVFADAGVADAAVNPASIGHGIGLEHWEAPAIAQPQTGSGDVRVREGMTLCVEPQIAGARGDHDWRSGLFMLEDQLVVTDTGAEVLTADLPRTLHLVEDVR